jgi:hypothetical protein
LVFGKILAFLEFLQTFWSSIFGFFTSLEIFFVFLLTFM